MVKTWESSLITHLACTLATGWKPNLSLSGAVESASQNNVSFFPSETAEGELEATDGSLAKADASRTEGVAGVVWRFGYRKILSFQIFQHASDGSTAWQILEPGQGGSEGEAVPGLGTAIAAVNGWCLRLDFKTLLWML